MSARKQLFSVGDYVVAVDETFGWGRVKAGDVGRVTHVTTAPKNVPFPYAFDVTFPSQQNWSCVGTDLRPASPAEQTRAKIALLKTPATYSTAPITTNSLQEAINQMASSQFALYSATPTAAAPKPRKPRMPSQLKGMQVGSEVMVLSTYRDRYFSPGSIYEVKRVEHSTKTAYCYNPDLGDWFWIEYEFITTDLSGPGKVSFDSVVLSDEKKQKIMATIKQVDNHDLIFKEWGFDEVLEKGRAISLLFYGPPGTGKTLMAQAIADHFKKKLKIIGSAEIESSEPGQAERNIKAFFEGTKSDTVLLFDECDSLVYSREHVGSILAAQVNQLLSSLEQYEGIVIFTTNRLGVLDEAFNRRLSLKLEFDMPSHAERIKIWQRMMPSKAPLHEDVSFEKLAEVELSGGYIKNVVLRAARMAANEDIKKKDKKITMQHLVEALTDEVESYLEFEAARSSNHLPKLAGGNAGISRTSDVRRTVERGTNR